MYTAPVLALSLVLLAVYRAALSFLETKFHNRFSSAKALLGTASNEETSPLDKADNSGPLWRALTLIFHYYTPLYLALGWMTFSQLKLAHRLLGGSAWLEPSAVRAAFADEKDLPEWWENELHNMLDGPDYLRILSIMAPFFLVLTFLVTLCNTLRQVYAVHCKRGGINGHPGHDSAILIIALPLIYSLMSFKSVMRMWMICLNDKEGGLDNVVDFNNEHSWMARLVMCQLMFKTNFMVADVYEAWALFQFAWLTLEVIGTQRKKNSMASGGDTKLEDEDSSQRGIESLTMQGIYLFILGCLLESSYYLVTSSVEAYAGQAALKFTMKVHSIQEQVHYFFLGVGSIASSAAIGNVVTVELTFHDLLKEFRPSGKFWSTKILVSLAFLQSLLLYVPPLNTLSVTESNLFYASMLCLECFGVSLLHWVAWNPQEGWYDTLLAYRK